MTNFHQVNRALGRPPAEKTVLQQINELINAGYLGTYCSTRWGWSNGWPLTLPGSGYDLN